MKVKGQHAHLTTQRHNCFCLNDRIYSTGDTYVSQFLDQPGILTSYVQKTVQTSDFPLTWYLAHAMIVLAAVPGSLAVAVAVAHRFPPRVLHTLVIPAIAAVRALPLPAAGLGRWHQLAAEKRETPAKDEPAARRAPSVRSRHRGCSRTTCSAMRSGLTLNVGFCYQGDRYASPTWNQRETKSWREKRAGGEMVRKIRTMRAKFSSDWIPPL